IGLLLAHSLTAMTKIPHSLLRVALLLFSLSLILPVAFIELLAPRVSPGNPRFVTGVCIIVALLGAANFLLALFGRPLRKKGLPLRAAACVLPILAATMLAYYIAPSCFKFDPSGKTIARQLQDRKSTRLNSSHLVISYAVF